ncbi:alpha-galactosidase [Streptomyces gilvus]|uniref:alpha-galactosidase n=1 Tax=Streptomyces gilvus TaxID=2920937 RepID=UPI001F0E2CC2|nr:alpha-galactosidase [Streptomyces sp. CME 23]MCH5672451.1 alpha-galactosidase [Streptomyces sp. CME 23]
MTSSLPTAGIPWIPGMPRLRPIRPLSLPDGVPRTVHAYVVPEDAVAVVHTECRLDEEDSTLRVRLRGSGRAMAVFLVPAADAVALWRPGSSQDQSSLPPSWADDTLVTPFTGTALGSLLGRNDRPVVTFGARAANGRLRMRAGIVEETSDLLLTFEADLAEGPMDAVLDLASDRFETAVAAISRALGMTRPAVDASAYAPVLCTWYSFHQALDTERLMEEARTAAGMGFGTLIVDDGWQTADCDRGYGSCGDWEVHPAKIADPAGLVRTLAGLGMRTLWWIGTPFLGHRSRAYADGLPTLYEEPDMEAAVLDPRSRRARDHLVSRLVDLVRGTGAAGLKIDFLERYATDTPAAPPDDAVDVSVPTAALSLLDEIHDALAPYAPSPMFEFREPYVSADTVGRAAMLRVADCPLSPVNNRVGIVDLRLTTRGAAVHSDPIMWGEADTPERVAQHLHSSLFGVPQISVPLHRQSPGQLRTLRAWLGLWNEYRDVLLHGSLRVTGIAGDYTTVEAARDGVTVTAQYAPAFSEAPADAEHWLVVNAHDSEVAVRSARPRTARFRMTDSTGDVTGEGTVTLDGLSVFDVPAGGVLRFSFASRHGTRS